MTPDHLMRRHAHDIAVYIFDLMPCLSFGILTNHAACNNALTRPGMMMMLDCVSGHNTPSTLRLPRDILEEKRYLTVLARSRLERCKRTSWHVLSS